MIKTVSLSANMEASATFGSDLHVRITNYGEELVYASAKSGVIAGADGVIRVQAGETKVLRYIGGTLGTERAGTDSTVYLLCPAASASVELESSNKLDFRWFEGGGGVKGNETGAQIDAYTFSMTHGATEWGRTTYSGNIVVDRLPESPVQNTNVILLPQTFVGDINNSGNLYIPQLNINKSTNTLSGSFNTEKGYGNTYALRLLIII